jgi:hypothetical protein
MFRLTLKSLASGSMVALATATAGFAQVSLQQKTHVGQASSFTCASHLRTYRVKSLNNGEFGGVRCVQFSDGTAGTRIPRLAWYGEGNWGSGAYRHVGHAFFRGSNLIGFASDIHGNGETLNNNFSGNLNFQILSSSIIRVSGAWNEEWQLVPSVNYNPLPKPSTCGGYFDQYKVSDLTENRQGEGLRCVLRVGPKNTTWFGNGNWEGSTYSHIGSSSFKGYGASDICDASFGLICNTFSFGSLKLTPVSGGFNVTGAWSEKWR